MVMLSAHIESYVVGPHYMNKHIVRDSSAINFLIALLYAAILKQECCFPTIVDNEL